MSSDYWMNAGILKEAQLLARSNNTVYLYSFDYVSTNFYETLAQNRKQIFNVRSKIFANFYVFIVGAVHGMDLALLIPGNGTLKSLGLPPWNLGRKDKQMQNILTNYWYHFVKSG